MSVVLPTHSMMDKDRQKSPAKRTVKESGPHQSNWSPRESEDVQLAKTVLNFKVGLMGGNDRLPFKPTPTFVPVPLVPSTQPKKHYCVLKNVHKTNYLNSVVQLLHHNCAFRNYVHENASSGPMHTALAQQFEQMDMMFDGSAVNVLECLRKYKPQFGSNVQHDAQQLWLALVEVMYKETSRDNRTVTALEHKTADQARQFVKANRLASLMMSQVETSVLCLECCLRTVSWSTVTKVQVDFPDRTTIHRLTLKDSLDNLFKEQTVSANCILCAKAQESSKLLSICEPPPPLLLVHIPRLHASMDQPMAINESLKLKRHTYTLSSAVLVQKTDYTTKYWTLVKVSDQKWIELRDDVDGIERKRTDAIMQLGLYGYLLLFDEVKVAQSGRVMKKDSTQLDFSEEELSLGGWITAENKDNNRNDIVANTYDLPFDDKPFGYCGLINLSFTCYANSCFQLLFTLNKVRGYIVDHPKQGHFHQALAALFTSMQTEANQPKTFDLYASPADFMDKFRLAKPQFRANQMADAQEYLTILLETIHQEANVAKKLSHTERPKVDPLWLEPKSAEESWNYHVQHMDQSYLSELFMGQIECSLLCCACEHKSLSWSCIWQLQVQIPNTQAQPNQDQTQQKEFTLLDCIKEYITTETLNMDSAPFCSECQSRQTATKGTTFSRVPHYLMVHLKRFTPDGIKIHVPVVINEHLNLAGQDYVLLSVVLHAGSESFGHNWAMHREGDNQWAKLDDRSVSKGLSNDYAKTELKEDAYVCVFEKVAPTETSAKGSLVTKV